MGVTYVSGFHGFNMGITCNVAMYYHGLYLYLYL